MLMTDDSDSTPTAIIGGRAWDISEKRYEWMKNGMGKIKDLPGWAGPLFLT